MAQYTNITREEIEPFLFVRGFKAMELPNTYELVYGKLVQTESLVKLSLRIYTGINGSDGNSRAKGKDAIRICLFAKDSEGNPKLIGVQRRVHRVHGWRHNLDERLNNWDDLLGPFCSKCNGYMVRRSPRRDKKRFFWGCSSWPICNGTRPYENNDDNVVEEEL